MSRRVLTIVVAVAALVILVAAVAAGHRQRSAEKGAIAQTRRATATVRRTAAAEPSGGQRSNQTKVCPRGAEGLGNSARRSIKRKLLSEEGRVDRAALAEMSNIAIAAARYLERARAAPALPQRMGREQTKRDGETVWEPIAYPKIGCAMVPRALEPQPD